MRTLHIWGGLGDLPSIDPECIATLGYVIHNGSLDQWKIVTEHDPSFSPNGDMTPIFVKSFAHHLFQATFLLFLMANIAWLDIKQYLIQ